ncbi:MAG: glycosyl hydrolase family 39 [Acidobacteriota bacterium]|nr:glycosyl hydrolase family 39 [Acidobacteriota bacterium]
MTSPSLSGVKTSPENRGLADAASDPLHETIHIDRNAPSHPFPHFWEMMFGSGRAVLSLRAGYRQDLRQVKEATGFEYIRFHGIFDRDVGLYSEDAAGHPVYNFSYVDQIYDGLLESGARPFVELSFMPRQLAAEPPVEQAFWYRPIVSPPKDWDKWANLITNFAQHLIDRYGIDEVSHWYFEVWNEPNLDFWAGNPKQESYFHLYDVTAHALKSVSPRLRVGGPATAQAAWIDTFIRHTVDDHVPVDFVSTHVYGNDLPENVLGSNQPVSRAQMVCSAARKVYDQVKASPLPNLPIIWSEYNASYKNEPDVTDAPFMGPWLADTIRRCDGLTEMMSYWTFSDVFEEQGVVKTPFYGGFGLMAEDNLPKPSFNAFQLLHKLGDVRIALNSDSALLTRRKDGALVMAVWNLFLPEQTGAPKSVTIDLDGTKSKGRILVSRLDDAYGSLLGEYHRMGSPAYPTRAQIAALRRAAELGPPEVEHFTGGKLNLVIPPQGLVILEFR